MIKEFTEEEQSILRQVAREVDEVYVEDRKGHPQTKYIMEVTEDMEFWCSELEDFFYVPKYLVGTWMMNSAHNLELDDLNDCISQFSWVKCIQVEKVVKVWEEIE